MAGSALEFMCMRVTSWDSVQTGQSDRRKKLQTMCQSSVGRSTSKVKVIVRVSHKELSVLKNHGIAREARTKELRGKCNKPSNLWPRCPPWL